MMSTKPPTAAVAGRRPGDFEHYDQRGARANDEQIPIARPRKRASTTASLARPGGVSAFLPFSSARRLPGALTKAEELTWHLDGPDGADRRWRREVFRRWPDNVAVPIAKQYIRIWNKDDRAAANRYLLSVREDARHVPLPLGADDDDIRALAKLRAKRCRALAAETFDTERALSRCQADTEGCSIVPPRPDGKRITVESALRRLKDDDWWCRALRRHFNVTIETMLIRAGLVHAHAGLYVSNHTLRRYRQRKARLREIIEATEAINELGEGFTLDRFFDASVSNPRIRRCELMMRAAGFEAIANELGHVGEFYTWTCPGRMHARYERSGDPVKRYDGTTPRQANDYLCQLWECVRSKLDRMGIHVYGIRVAEPMHDGTPHWHMLLFMPKRHCKTVRAILRDYALRRDGNEKGARKRRFKAKRIDPNKGTAVGYLAKYIAKNIDGFGLENDERLSPADKAERVQAWASTWHIRQFQQIGGPSVSIWRELRRRRTPIEGDPVLEAARLAADNNDWAGFVRAQGGINRPRKHHAIQLLKAYSDKAGRYGEPAGWQTLGVRHGNVNVPTRIHTWTFSYKKPNRTGEASMGCEAIRRAEIARIGAQDLTDQKFCSS